MSSSARWPPCVGDRAATEHVVSRSGRTSYRQRALAERGRWCAGVSAASVRPTSRGTAPRRTRSERTSSTSCPPALPDAPSASKRLALSEPLAQELVLHHLRHRPGCCVTTASCSRGLRWRLGCKPNQLSGKLATHAQRGSVDRSHPAKFTDQRVERPELDAHRHPSDESRIREHDQTAAVVGLIQDQRTKVRLEDARARIEADVGARGGQRLPAHVPALVRATRLCVHARSSLSGCSLYRPNQRELDGGARPTTTQANESVSGTTSTMHSMPC